MKTSSAIGESIDSDGDFMNIPGHTESEENVIMDKQFAEALQDNMVIQNPIGLGEGPHMDKQEQILDAHDDQWVSFLFLPII